MSTYPSRAYSIQDVFKQINDQGLPTVAENPSEVVNQLAGPMIETAVVTDSLSISTGYAHFNWGPTGTHPGLWNLAQWS